MVKAKGTAAFGLKH